MKFISLLGATGSIGEQTLDVIRQHREAFQVQSLSFGQNMEKAIPLIHEFKPKKVCVAAKELVEPLRKSIHEDIDVYYGIEGLIEIVCDERVDVVVNAVIGSVGLLPTLKAIEHKKTIAIANKETLVTAGHLVMEAAHKHEVKLLPVDSEHSAIFQCLNGEKESTIERIILTASGGSFRDRNRDELQQVTVADALNHPNWSMGAKITIDSATMMNKGLEVIEAHWLFNLPYDQIDVLLHKESIIHSMVEFHDRSVIAQLGTPDMRVPIMYALTYPDRLPLQSDERLDLAKLATLHFANVDFERYKSLKMAYDAGRAGGIMPTILNAANEEAVGAFLQERITFLEIEDMVEHALLHFANVASPDLETILHYDEQARALVREVIKTRR